MECENCGKRFGGNPRCRYCSRRCKIAARDRRKDERQGIAFDPAIQVCEWCQTAYTPIRRAQRFCGSECRQVASEHRRRERRGRTGTYIPKARTRARIATAIRQRRIEELISNDTR